MRMKERYQPYPTPVRYEIDWRQAYDMAADRANVYLFDAAQAHEEIHSLKYVVRSEINRYAGLYADMSGIMLMAFIIGSLQESPSFTIAFCSVISYINYAANQWRLSRMEK